MAHYLNLVRVPAIILRSQFGRMPPLHPLGTDVVACRVLPWDIDYNLHLNNSRYLSYMDYGRIHLLARLGLLKNFFARQHTGLVGSIDITYRRPLDFGARFTVSSRMACWDDKWFYMEQTFHGSQGLATHAWVKTLFRGPQGNLIPQQVADKMFPGVISPPLPERLVHWNAVIRETLHAVDENRART